MHELRKRTEKLFHWLLHGPPDAREVLRARAWAGRRDPRPPPRSVCRPRLVRADDRQLEVLARTFLQRLDPRELVQLRESAPRLSALLDQLREGPLRAPRIRALLGSAALETRELDHAAELFAAHDRDAQLGLLLAHASL